MFIRMAVFNGITGNDVSELIARPEISFPLAIDEEGNYVRVLLYKPGEWLNIWEREMLIDGKPHKVRLSVMEDPGNGDKEVSQTSISGSDTSGSSTLKPEDFS